MILHLQYKTVKTVDNNMYIQIITIYTDIIYEITTLSCNVRAQHYKVTVMQGDINIKK